MSWVRLKMLSTWYAPWLDAGQMKSGEAASITPALLKAWKRTSTSSSVVFTKP